MQKCQFKWNQSKKETKTYIWHAGGIVSYIKFTQNDVYLTFCHVMPYP